VAESPSISQTRSITVRLLLGNFHGDSAKTIWRVSRAAPYQIPCPTCLAGLTLQVEAMQILASSSAVLPVRGLPEGVHVRGEMQPRVVRNEGEHMNEEHELVYEISWIEELGLWRTFLWSQHKVKH
jgi:hypothetical protein